jgi:hypothetical protein
MENNIFFREKKNKYNPDVDTKLQSKEIERNTQEFNVTTTIYNPITGIIPAKIKDSKDLVIDKPNVISKSDMQKLILRKEEERKQQDIVLKPVKTKVVSNTMQEEAITIPVQQNPPPMAVAPEPQQQQPRNYISTFNDMKREANNGGKKQEKTIKNSNYSHILDGLKDLGIIK